METIDADEKLFHSRVQAVGFPWLSAVAGLLALGYFLLTAQADLAAYLTIPEAWLQPDIQYALLGLFVLLLLRDSVRYFRQSRRQKADLKRLRRQVDELWQSKKQLQLKAHTYSGHADKLKLFISDKLLDYIEYDEKFLHFKSIAAEVRHNGVISFDKVQTALQLAAARTDSESTESIKDALEAMRYLWDLLDLSTADNLALHIGNVLCECEEHYYQRMLNMHEAAPLPYEPAYAPQYAAWRALGLVRQDLPPLPEEGEYRLDDNQWHINLAPVSELLGNKNHLVLLLENLLKNAQFFANKRGYRSPFASIAITLFERWGQACFQVYNRGPHIAEEDRHNLFQLGFSTRRAREHHGRGLGLYFVNEIVKGYEGRVLVRNIHTPGARYTVRIELADDQVITELVEVQVEEEQPRCRAADGELLQTRDWAFAAPLRSVEVTSTSAGEGDHTLRLSDFARKGKQSRFDPGHPQRPHWQLSYHAKRNNHQLSFQPLNISGVEFEVRLPTAQQRLDSSELELDQDLDAEVERLDERFRSPL